jgi:hypothetical protein
MAATIYSGAGPDAEIKRYNIVAVTRKQNQYRRRWMLNKSSLTASDAFMTGYDE